MLKPPADSVGALQAPFTRVEVTLNEPESPLMRPISSAIVVLAVLFATEASAQSVNLTGAYRCVEACGAGPAGGPAFITQNGPNLNLLNEAGQPAQAWPDLFAPA